MDQQAYLEAQLMAEVFADEFRPGEKILEGSAATLLEGLELMALPDYVDPESNLILTNQRMLYRDLRGSAEFHWQDVKNGECRRCAACRGLSSWPT